MKPSDALIIGGGPAGSAAAILLAKAGWRVTIVERKEFPRRKVCGEYLSATNWPLLESLGIAEPFAGSGSSRSSVADNAAIGTAVTRSFRVSVRPTQVRR